MLKHDLGRVLLKLEAVQSEQLAAALTKEDKAPKLDDSEHAEALALLKSPDLLDRIVADFTACGVVGEATNTLVDIAWSVLTTRLPYRSQVKPAATCRIATMESIPVDVPTCARRNTGPLPGAPARAARC